MGEGGKKERRVMHTLCIHTVHITVRAFRRLGKGALITEAKNDIAVVVLDVYIYCRYEPLNSSNTMLSTNPFHTYMASLYKHAFALCLFVFPPPFSAPHLENIYT
jgi:hypothetical protein